jgi:hypothetical protein
VVACSHKVFHERVNWRSIFSDAVLAASIGVLVAAAQAPLSIRRMYECLHAVDRHAATDPSRVAND